ncbi:C40 family peptidase [Mycobacterium sp. SMC-2]|uniref:C40 family peptidase n=1 Tax=Mycobacterium sp. SMC-2 TaxID=2857058 RepID=UPI0021B18B51|nr:C40 family peptidase [Mycobacterium sp. SMC-2]UXA07213.1 C40 family peptidase [Mycobacterium sp. SMC-2]
MTESEIELLSRAHDMFVGGVRLPSLDSGTGHHRNMLQRLAGASDGLAHGGYRLAVEHSRQRLAVAAATDAAAAGVIAGADRDRARARDLTRNVLDEARADAAVIPATPLAQREAMRRRAARLRAQRAHILSARFRARRRVTELRALRYQLLRHRAARLGNGRAAIAVRAALSRLGRPYVWGATGPDQFDCSGLVQWSYAQAGVHLDRTTYQQINDGLPVPRSQVRPGDLVFPHAGHVQLAIGNDLVVEAPYSGASVRISPMGPHVAIRRPL